MQRGTYKRVKHQYSLVAYDVRTGKQIESQVVHGWPELLSERAKLRTRLINRRQGRYRVEIMNTTTRQRVK